jgi:hypothetical protein
MSQLPNPITARDFSGGRVTKYSVATSLAPVNSVANAINVDFSEIIGSGIVRKGKGGVQTIVASSILDQSHVAGSDVSHEIYGVNELAQTFTPAKGTILGLGFKIEKVGNPKPLLISLNGTTTGSPNSSVTAQVTIDPSLIATSPTVVIFPLAPFGGVTPASQYSIILSSAGSDSSNYYVWTLDTSGGYGGGAAFSSTNSGATWGTIGTGDFYFTTYSNDTTTPFSQAPLGDFSFLLSDVLKNVCVFPNSLLSRGVLYYLNTTTNQWNPSDLQNLDAGTNVRFTVMSGSVFEVNGIQVMQSSADAGKTWTTQDCITTNSILPSLLFVAQNRMLAAGDPVYQSRIFFSSIVDPVTATKITISAASAVYSAPNSTITVTTAVAHNYETGDWVTVYGTNKALTGYYQITVIDPLNFSYVVLNTTASGAVTGLSTVSGPFITWNTDPTDGDWIDVDPDSGGIITGFANASTLTLVFKNNAFYRLNAIAKTIDAENIFNVGAVSQEAICSVLGLTYFYSGNGIYSTDSTFPIMISRLGVQDFVDAISNPLQVYSWDDGFSVYFSIGNITLNYGPNDSRTYQNVVLKYSPRDQNWSIFSYNVQLGQMADYSVSSTQMYVAEFDGNMAVMQNSSNIDDGDIAIIYSLETQELEVGDRSHTKKISDKIVVFTRDGNEGSFLVKCNDGNFVSAKMTLENRVNVGTNSIDFEGEFFTFRWQGEASYNRPVFQGYSLPTVTDQGITKNT